MRKCVAAVGQIRILYNLDTTFLMHNINHDVSCLVNSNIPIAFTVLESISRLLILILSLILFNSQISLFTCINWKMRRRTNWSPKRLFTCSINQIPHLKIFIDEQDRESINAEAESSKRKLIVLKIWYMQPILQDKDSIICFPYVITMTYFSNVIDRMRIRQELDNNHWLVISQF